MADNTPADTLRAQILELVRQYHDAAFPARTFAATAGLASIASSTTAASSPASLTTARPRAATTSSGVPAPATTPPPGGRAGSWRGSGGSAPGRRRAPGRWRRA